MHFLKKKINKSRVPNVDEINEENINGNPTEEKDIIKLKEYLLEQLELLGNLCKGRNYTC